jgi:hypothetical protein
MRWHMFVLYQELCIVTGVDILTFFLGENSSQSVIGGQLLGGREVLGFDRLVSPAARNVANRRFVSDYVL